MTDALGEALAELYVIDGRYEKAFALYVDLMKPDIFDFLKKHNLHDALCEKIRDLKWTCLVIWRAGASSFFVFIHITLHVFWLRCKFYIFVGITGHVW
ncbi:hypothetical protein ACSBR2_042821 [Camellia fascicularis]